MDLYIWYNSELATLWGWCSGNPVFFKVQNVFQGLGGSTCSLQPAVKNATRAFKPSGTENAISNQCKATNTVFMQVNTLFTLSYVN